MGVADRLSIVRRPLLVVGRLCEQAWDIWRVGVDFDGQYDRGMVLGLDHVQLACPRDSEEEARGFYGGLLGLEEIEKPEPLRARGGCWFRVGSRQLHLGVEEPFQAATKAHPAFAVFDAEEAFRRLEAAGVRCAWDDALPGVKRFYAEDPWGNRLEFLESSAR